MRCGGPAAFHLKSVVPPEISPTGMFRDFLPFIGAQLIALAVMLIRPPVVTRFL